MRSYPQNMQDQVKHLKQLITEKLDAKKTVHLPFKPGTNEIVLEASINRRVNQYFILDTGATHVTISSKTAVQLGIKINEDTPVRTIRTASDLMLAYEVTLDSIEVGDLRADSVIALIIDLPGTPEVGLLGNSFLKHFNVEIDNKNGLLKLTPR
jgi:clan AA aspartic protease (TIGR02281 family)